MRRRQFLAGAAGAAGLGLTGLAPTASANSARTAARSSHTTAASWSEVAVPEVGGAARLAAVAAEGSNRAWAVGSQLRGEAGLPDAPLALTWDGSEWAETDTSALGRNGGMDSVSAGGSGNTWAVSPGAEGGGQLLAWDSTTWQHTPYPGEGQPGASLTAVLAQEGGEAWAVGSPAGGEPALLHWDGSSWSWTAPLSGGAGLLGLSRAPDGSVWVFGAETVARWDGGWTPVAYDAPIRSGITGLLPTASDDVWLTGWAYGAGGPVGKPPSVVLRRFDGTQWTSPQPPYSPGSLTGPAAGGPGAPVLIGGWDFWEQTRAHYARWEAGSGDGGAWVSELGPDAGAGSSVFPNALAAIPGTEGGCWSVGHLGGDAIRIERRG